MSDDTLASTGLFKNDVIEVTVLWNLYKIFHCTSNV